MSRGLGDLELVYGLSGLGQFESNLAPQTEAGIFSAINRTIDIIGSKIAKQPSPYVSPDDPRYRQQPPNTPQNVWNSPPAMNVTGNTLKEKSSGITIDKNTLILGAVVIGFFLLGKGRR